MSTIKNESEIHTVLTRMEQIERERSFVRIPENRLQDYLGDIDNYKIRNAFATALIEACEKLDEKKDNLTEESSQLLDILSNKKENLKDQITPKRLKFLPKRNKGKSIFEKDFLKKLLNNRALLTQVLVDFKLAPELFNNKKITVFKPNTVTQGGLSTPIASLSNKRGASPDSGSTKPVVAPKKNSI